MARQESSCGSAASSAALQPGTFWLALICFSVLACNKPPPSVGERIASTATPISFSAINLHADFLSEGAAFADFDQDGDQDIVAGPYWYEGPSFSTRHELYPAQPNNPECYSDNFFAFIHDFNNDSWPDVLVIGFPGEPATWLENPQNAPGAWPPHPVFDPVDTESPTFVDLTGDGAPELVCAAHGKLGWLTPDSTSPFEPWTFHPLSPADSRFGRFAHGLGVGDVNGDGRQDVLEASGWWEQPTTLNGDPPWIYHAAYFGNGGAQMFAYDVDGDGDNDVIAALNAHGYGIAWFEQTSNGFTAHPISEGPGGMTPLHQPHALFLFDMNSDGLQDIVGGERFWGHVDKLLDFGAPAQLVWFELRRGDDRVDFIPHTIHEQSGVGTQVLAGRVNNDSLPDIVVASKKGAFVFIQDGPSPRPPTPEPPQFLFSSYECIDQVR